MSGNDDSSLDSNSNPPKKFNVGDCVSQVENDGMWKIRTIYIYRNQYVLNQAVAQFKPLAGILQSVETGFEFLTVSLHHFFTAYPLRSIQISMTTFY